LSSASLIEQSDEADRVRELSLVIDEIIAVFDSAMSRSVTTKEEAIAVFPTMVKGRFRFARYQQLEIISVRDIEQGIWSPPAP